MGNMYFEKKIATCKRSSTDSEACMENGSGERNSISQQDVARRNENKRLRVLCPPELRTIILGATRAIASKFPISFLNEFVHAGDRLCTSSDYYYTYHHHHHHHHHHHRQQQQQLLSRRSVIHHESLSLATALAGWYKPRTFLPKFRPIISSNPLHPLQPPPSPRAGAQQPRRCALCTLAHMLRMA